MDNKIFDDILENKETLVKIYKPNKCKYAWSVAIWSFWIVLWVAIMCISIGVGITEEFTELDNLWIMFVIMGAASLLTIGIIVLFTSLHYKNTFYAYSNKRILIRTGIFGIDYKSLEYKALTATIVTVSLIDKLVRKNTGTIQFGSYSSQIGANANGTVNPYRFSHIEKPYETLREIKAEIEKFNENSEK